MCVRACMGGGAGRYAVDPFARPLRATEKRDEFAKLEADQKKVCVCACA